MSQSTNDRKCHYCDKQVHGRADKKFCNDYCRNAFNNQLRTDSSKLVRNINSTLVKNRKILEEILKEQTCRKASKENLLMNGFNFKYQTHSLTNKKGSRYSFCYDCGYLPLDNEWILVVKAKQEDVESLVR